MPTCFDPATTRQFTVASGPCPGASILVPPTTPTRGPNIPSEPSLGTAATQQATQAGQAAQGLIPNINVNVPNPLSGLSNSWLGRLAQDPATYKQIGLVAAGLMLVLIGVPLLFLGGRNRQPTEVIANNG